MVGDDVGIVAVVVYSTGGFGAVTSWNGGNGCSQSRSVRLSSRRLLTRKL